MRSFKEYFFLNEMFDSSVNNLIWTTIRDQTLFDGYFKASNNQYISISISKEEPDYYVSNYVKEGFETIDKNIQDRILQSDSFWELSFSIVSPHEKYKGLLDVDFNKTGTGAAPEIFGKVINAVAEFNKGEQKAYRTSGLSSSETLELAVDDNREERIEEYKRSGEIQEVHVEPNMDVIAFTAKSEEQSRVDLYNTMIRILPRKFGYNAVSCMNAEHNTNYFIFKK